MAEHPEEKAEQAPSAGSSSSRSRLLGTGRRRFLLASAPFAVTLANRAALAGGSNGGGWTQICSPSAMMSVNLSRAADLGPTDSYNCGVSPGCWKNLALGSYHGKTGLWETTDYTTDSSLKTAFFAPDYVAGTQRWKVEGSLYDGLCGSGIKYKLTTGDWAYVPGGTIANFVAALLNASAWGASGHFPYLAATVASQVQALWNTGGSGSYFSNQSQVETAANSIKYLYNYEQYNGGGEDPCGAYL